MKHKLSITLTLLAMFLATQFIGLYVLSKYSPTGSDLPFGLDQKPEETPTFTNLIISFVIAFFLIFLLMKYQWKVVLKIWFFFVITIALGISLYAIIGRFFPYKTKYIIIFGKVFVYKTEYLILFIAVYLAMLKLFKPSPLIHNATEMLIYPGIATIFVPILNPLTVILLLIIISFYDMWAVWKSGIMQKMAKFQMEELKIFGGFLLPSMSKKTKEEIKKLKAKYKKRKVPKSVSKKKFRISLAILGGGDIIFPIITSGVFLKTYGFTPTLFIIGGAFLGLSYLFFITRKGKSYPAMPYITTGILAGIILWKILLP